MKKFISALIIILLILSIGGCNKSSSPSSSSSSSSNSSGTSGETTSTSYTNSSQDLKKSSQPYEITDFKYVGDEDKISGHKSPGSYTPDNIPDGHYKITLRVNEETVLGRIDISGSVPFENGGIWVWSDTPMNSQKSFAALYLNDKNLISDYMNPKRPRFQPGVYDLDLYLTGQECKFPLKSPANYELKFLCNSKDNSNQVESKIIIVKFTI